MSQAFPQPKDLGVLRNALLSYQRNLVNEPIKTKMITGGALFFLQEVLADYLSGVPPKPVKKSGNPITDTLAPYERALKLAFYGAFINAPISHYLVEWLQRTFAGQVGAKAKILQILASNIVVLPVILAGYIGSQAVVNGARSIDTVIRAILANFWKAYRVSAVTNPLSVIVAQNFIPAEFWVPFFAMVSFVRGTQINVQTKRIQAKRADL